MESRQELQAAYTIAALLHVLLKRGDLLEEAQLLPNVPIHERPKLHQPAADCKPRKPRKRAVANPPVVASFRAMRYLSRFIALLLLVPGLLGATPVQLCIGDEHVVVAPSDDHQLHGCCAHTKGCTDIVVAAQPHLASVNANSPGLRALAILPQAVADHHRSPAAPRLAWPRYESPPPLGLVVIRTTVLRI
jgi:hypothetical protein